MLQTRALFSLMKSDQELVTAFTSGSRQAGEELVDRYYATVLGFFRNKAPTASHDLAQQTFAECFSGLKRLRDASRLRSFLFGIASNLLRAHYRSRSGSPLDFTVASAVDLDPSPSAVVAQNQRQQRVIDGLRRIPVDYQLVLELHYWEELSGPDIADVLGLPLGTIKTRIRRGRELLAAVLAEDAAKAVQADDLHHRLAAARE